MQKNKRLLLAAAASAALFVGGYEVSNAYTYSGAATTVDKVAEDKSDLVITNRSSVTGTNNQNPYKYSTFTEDNLGNNPEYTVITAAYDIKDLENPDASEYDIGDSLVLRNNISTQFAQNIINDFKNGLSISNINSKYGDKIVGVYDEDSENDINFNYEYGSDMGCAVEYNGSYWSAPNLSNYQPSVGDRGYDDNARIHYHDIEYSYGNIKKPASITVSNNSLFIGNSDISSGISTTVTGNSSLTAKGNFTTPTLTVADSNVTVGSNATVASGGLKTTGSSKVDASNGTLTVENGAVNIAKGGILKAKVLKAAATGTETSVIGSSTNIQGTLTVAGQVKGVTAGTASTDAVNKGQLDSAVNTLTTKISQGGKTYTAGSDIDISSANAISVKKAGLITYGNTGLVTGGTVYSTTNALNTQITATSQAVESLSDKISTYGKTISSISTSVTNTLSSMKNTQANFVDTSLSNISSDGRDVIKQVVKDVLAANTASTTSSTASAKSANLLKASFVAAPMRATANLTAGDYVDISGNTISVKADGTVASGNTGLVTGGAVYEAVKDKADKSYVDEGLAKKADISYVDQGLSQKVNVSDFTPVKQQVETNTSDISALKTGKADTDGSNINVGSFAAKLNTGKVEKGNTGLVSGGTVYDSLQTKADVGYVNTMGLALNSEIKGTAQGLHNEIQDMGNRLTKDINRVGAGSAALAALHPQDFNPDDKWDFAVGYGHYKNANASAVGAFYRPNVGTTVSLAATIGNGDPQVSAGVSFKIGMGKNVEKVVITKDKYDKLNQTVESQNERIEKLEAMVQKFMTSGK